MSLSSIVSVTISRETSVPTQQGFGAAAFVSDDAEFEGRVKIYSSATEANADTMAGAKSKAFATKYFSQEVKPEKLYVIKKGADKYHIQTVTLSGDLVASNTVSVDVDGETVSTVFATDHDTTLAALATAIAAKAAVATATVTGAREITVTGATYGDDVALTNATVTGGASQATVTVATTQYADTAMTLVESLQNAQTVNDEWYAIAIASRADADISAVAAYVEAQFKIFMAVSADTAILGTGTADIASVIKAAGYERSWVMYSADAANWPEAGLLGGQLPKDPGSITWSYKQISGITVDTLSTTEKTNAHGKNAMTYTAVAGISITEPGQVASGEFIDVIRGSDYIVARMRELVFQRLANADKIPYTDAGVAVIENLMRQVLRDATNKGILAADPEFTITVPKVADVSVANKGARTLPSLEFQGTLAGAIHKIQIQGTLVL